MKDALNYNVEDLKEKQILSLNKILIEFIDENKEYYEDKDYIKEIIDTINKNLKEDFK